MLTAGRRLLARLALSTRPDGGPTRAALSGALLVLLLAVAGNGVACLLAARATGEGWRESAGIGTLMNARGLMELIILNIGLREGIVTPTLFTIMVLMAAVTTLMTSPLFTLLFRRSVAPSGAALNDGFHPFLSRP